MDARSLAERIEGVERGDFVTLAGHPTQGESKWHVNKTIYMAIGPNIQSCNIVLQLVKNGNPAEEWLVMTLKNETNEWNTTDVRGMDNPSMMGGGDTAGTEIDPTNLTIVSIDRD